MKKTFKYVVIAILVCIIVIVVYLYPRISYHGASNIILIEKGYTSFDSIIKKPEFKNKVVYVDVWGTSCQPCFNEFRKYTPQLTTRYKDSTDIVFLYLCIDRQPFPEIRWKSKISEFKPEGYHYLIRKDEEVKLTLDIVRQAVDGHFFPYQPCYFIINKNGEYVKRPTLDYNEGELEPNTTSRLYRKLDSLRHL